MNIYIAHSRHGFDYQKELYSPLEDSVLAEEYSLIFPHKATEKPTNSKERMKDFDVVVAEVTYPATGMGIELGWADVFGTPIVCIYKKGAKISNSLHSLTDNFIEYENSADMIEQLREKLTEMKSEGMIHDQR